MGTVFFQQMKTERERASARFRCITRKRSFATNTRWLHAPLRYKNILPLPCE